jgi:hypothetical protein
MAKDTEWNIKILTGIIIITLIFLCSFYLTYYGPKSSCKPPYINAGNSCCLDDNYNNICDSEETEFSKNLNVKTYITQNGIYYLANPETLPASPEIIVRDYKVLNTWVGSENYYDAGTLFFYTDYNKANPLEEITCHAKEYYNGNLNTEFNVTISRDFAYAGVIYEKTETPKEVRYDYECQSESGAEYLSSYTVYPVVG